MFFFVHPNLLRNKAGQTPLHFAALRGEQWIIEELEERGAMSSIVAADEDGLTPLGLANAEGNILVVICLTY